MIAFLRHEYRNYVLPFLSYVLPFIDVRPKEERWIDMLPYSHMRFPTAAHDRVKYWFWFFYTPFHPYVRDVLTFLGVVYHEGRQDFLVGILDSKRSLRELAYFLVSQGYGNHFVAWRDTDEILSLRKPVGFRYQYHIRVFRDGEVRCHYEYTPEYRPVRHLVQIGFEDRSKEFQKLLSDWVVPADTIARV